MKRIARTTAALTILAAMSAPATAQNGGLITRVNLTYLKSVFDQYGIPATIKNDDGGAYVLAHLEGNPVFLTPLNCAGNDPNGECLSFSVMSGIWPTTLSNDTITDYALNPGFASILRAEEGRYLMRYSVIARDGIGPKYLEGTLSQFSLEMKSFAQYLAQQERAGGGGAASGSTTPGFAAVADPSVLKFRGEQNLPATDPALAQPTAK